MYFDLLLTLKAYPLFSTNVIGEGLLQPHRITRQRLINMCKYLAII